jgi:Domain of unknown function (DUF4184)
VPFTFSHPIAVVPLARSPLVFSALVVGSLSPDFEYFLLFATTSIISHSWLGILVFCLPAGLVVLWLWHYLLKDFLVELLPDAHYQRLRPVCRPFSFFPASRFLLIALSIVIGAATHFLWDSFTHSYGWGVQNISILNTIVLQTSFYTLRFFRVLQHGSTLLGLTALAILYVRWYQRAKPQGSDNTRCLSAKARLRIIVVAIIIAASVALTCAWAISPPMESFYAFRKFVVKNAVVGMGTLGVELATLSMWWYIVRRTQ